MKDIVLIHGTWCDGNVWGEFKNKLEELGLRVHTPSLRYHDLPYEEVEQKVGRVSLGEYTDDIVKLVESLEEPPLVLGHSLGGLIAQLVAEKTKVSGLILMGTAPETPSFLVNQDELKKKIAEKFCDFFDVNNGQGLEVVFLKSNYGNGKSHFIRTIYTFLSEYENVITRRVSLKQEETDLKKKILESISQKVLKECATFLINSVEADALSGEEAAILMAVEEKYSIDASLAKLLYEAARSNDVVIQVQAIAILKGNFLPEYLKNFGVKKQELNSEFYYNVIKLVSIYLKEIDYFLVIVFDEYEHVFSWKSEKYRKNLYEDIKLFTDNIATFGNMFFVFAESDSVDNESESSDDPAFKSRKANLMYQIADISSETEVEKLFIMILKRYEKYYEVSFEAYTDDILQMIYDDPMIREKTNYRAYTQAIMRVLDQFRNKPPKVKGVRRGKDNDYENGKLDERDNIEKEKYGKWEKATSISKKTMLCEMIEKMLDISKENIVFKSKKKGEYVTRKNQYLKRYYIISTDNPSKKDFEKRVVNLQDVISSEEEKIYIIYPASEEDIVDNSNIKTILYNDSTVENSFKMMYGNEVEECDMDMYLSTLDIRRSNAKD